MQGQCPFEQDDGHRQGHQREQQLPQQLIRIEQTRHRAEQQAAQQQKQNGGHPQEPGQPLRQQGDQGDPRQGECDHANLGQVRGLGVV
ncbi:hypothetical protein D3C86_1942840 [compost metagenome]